MDLPTAPTLDCFEDDTQMLPLTARAFPLVARIVLGLLGLGLVAPVLPAQAPPEPPAKEGSGTTIGIYALDRRAREEAVVDGDTVRLVGLNSSIRLFGVDAEETFKQKGAREAAEKDFDAYAREMRGDRTHPAKYATPEGEAAKHFAQEFFHGVEKVQMEVDDPAQPTEYYGRYLGYLLVDRNGDGTYEQNFNVELVRAGHSPYFIKYGYSLRYHEAFAAAEKEARDQKRGIWSEAADAPRHYPDYAERTVWWARRAELVKEYAARHAADPAFFRLGYAKELDRLQALVKQQEGATVTLFGVVVDKFEPEAAPTRAFLSHRLNTDVALVFSTPEDWQRLNLTAQADEIVYVQAKVFPARGKAGVEVRIDAESKVWTKSPAVEK